MSENMPALVGAIVGELQLPSGGHVVLRDPAELRARDKRRVIANIEDPDRRMLASIDLIEGVICMIVAKWELPYLPNAPLPADQPSILGELKIPDYDALYDAAEPAQRLLFPGRPSPDDAGKPGTPTPPASG